MVKSLGSVLIASCLVVLCTSCASVPRPGNPDVGMGRIIVYRVSAMFGYAQRSSVFIGDSQVAKSSPGKMYFVDVKPGAHTLKIPTPLGEGERLLEVTVREGEVVYVKTWLGGSAFGGYTNMQVVTVDVGIKETDGLEFDTL